MRWGIDLGGTKIEGVILPPDGIEPIARIRIPTEADGGYDHILSRIGLLVDLLGKEAAVSGPDVIGIGTPGAIDPQSGLMKNANTTCLSKRPLDKDLEKALGFKVICANDANCFALAEARFGAAKGASTVFGVIMGTGVGGGLVVDGRVLNGLQGIAGEWGHNPVEPGGKLCYCGRRGCVETVISGPFLEAYYQDLTGNHLRLPEILSRLDSDDAAKSTHDRLIEFFGKALAVVLNTLDPEVVVLGGGVGNVDSLLTLGLKSVEENLFNDRLATRILKPELGDSAGVFGAATLPRAFLH